MKATIVFQKNWEAINAMTYDEKGNPVLNGNGVPQRKYRYIIDEGSSRSSKTVSLIDCYDLYARANNNKRMTVWRDTKTDCKKTVLNDTLKHLKKTGRYKNGQDFNKTESIFTYSTGSTFEIHGTDDSETVHGLTQDVAWFNEPYRISRDTFDQIDQRTSDFIFIDWNPKKAHWIEDIKKDKRTLVIHSTFKDNPFCPEEQRVKILSYQPVKFCDAVESKLLTESEAREYNIETNTLCLTEKQIEELSRCRENELKNSANEFNWMVYGLGLKAEKPNRIFRWIEIPEHEYRALDAKTYVGVDWGTVDPWGILEAKYYDGGLYLHELNYLSENQIREKLTPVELEHINAQDEGIVTFMFNKLSISKTSPIVCDSNRLLKIAALRRAGWSAIPAIKPAGSIIDGIDLLNNLKVYYTHTSANLKYEQENYSRKVDRYGVILEEPEDVDNHLADPSRYLATYLQYLGIIKRV
jgi:phage terminase large subunit